MNVIFWVAFVVWTVIVAVSLVKFVDALTQPTPRGRGEFRDETCVVATAESGRPVTHGETEAGVWRTSGLETCLLCGEGRSHVSA